MSEDIPEIFPERGTDNAMSTPFDRDIGISSESGL
jgi:hypothetical protein